MGLLRWLRGDVDALDAAKRKVDVETSMPRADHPGANELRNDLVRDLGVPADAQVVSFDVEVETKARQGDSSLEAVQPRIRQESGRFVVDVEIPGLRPDTLAVDGGEAETRVRGEGASGAFVVRLRAEPAVDADAVEVSAEEDLLTISCPAPLP